MNEYLTINDKNNQFLKYLLLSYYYLNKYVIASSILYN